MKPCESSVSRPRVHEARAAPQVGARFVGELGHEDPGSCREIVATGFFAKSARNQAKIEDALLAGSRRTIDFSRVTAFGARNRGGFQPGRRSRRHLPQSLPQWRRGGLRAVSRLSTDSERPSGDIRHSSGPKTNATRDRTCASPAQRGPNGRSRRKRDRSADRHARAAVRRARARESRRLSPTLRGAAAERVPARFRRPRALRRAQAPQRPS